MDSILSTLSFILQHPLNRRRKAEALARYVRWQVGSRMQVGPVAVPFVGGTRLLVQPGMTGATGNVYCGLHEFEDMGFVLHLLRPGDLFADVGANVGSYTVLAAGAAGAQCIAFEPVPSTFAHLQDNVRLNGIEYRVRARNMGVGSRSGTLPFTATLDTMNRVVAPGEKVDGVIEVPVEPLDDVLAGAGATLLKIDVEGFETEVLNGAAATLANPALLGVVMELNGSGEHYGYDERALQRRMLELGFVPARYDPLRRVLAQGGGDGKGSGNTLYVRDLDRVRERLSQAPRFAVLGARV